MGANKQTNNNSIISLTLGILSIIIPVIGLVLGVIGVIVSRIATNQIVKTNEGGSGLATSGLICSIVGIVIQIFSVMGVVTFFSSTTVG
ncbi:DUF4190 domain-containing protein [Pseudalkalibacillus berkeleyi]|uniref:DUF4190 domain-containing protein n=1 Tax=Pseudalkalibacillus berkeleyi TaxID=1069813 RepID=A0ABS9H1G4_9BACL|nr:DUF4190 domain-containing protein [Pseudalkalibacillus berkeleyi]MCF6137744.1 DUF4190 domain-containing protein [Pseudalkalibacillus berkeleyi]